MNRFEKRTRGGAAGIVLVVTGCNVSSPPPGTGGVVTDGGVCPSSVSIMASDYTSTDIAIAKTDGTTLSGAFVSSGSTIPGLSLALSGDVDVPFVPPASGRVVVIDRYGTNVLTWMDLAKATVLAQLAIGTGFDANPQDYVEVDATRAFVSRYGTNPAPGQQMYDQGGDLLVVDTTQYAITGRIPMPEENPALQPSPAGMNWIGKDVVVTLQRLSSDFSQIGDGRFVGVSPATNSIDWTVDIAGLQNCGRVVVSPSGNTAAIACSSMADASGAYDPSESDIVVYDATQSPPVEKKRLGLGVSLNAGIQPQIVFASEDEILALTYGGNATSFDTVFAVSASTAAVTQLGAATMPFVLGGVYCTPGCGDVCLLADAEQNALRRWQVSNGGTFTALSNQPVDPTVGLPPRDIGGLL